MNIGLNILTHMQAAKFIINKIVQLNQYIAIINFSVSFSFNLLFSQLFRPILMDIA